MPTVLKEGSYRFFFYSRDRDEPPHVHVQEEPNIAKVWLDPVRLDRIGKFDARELRRIIEMVTQHQAVLMEAWNEHFKS